MNLKDKFSSIPTRWKIALPMFALVLIAVVNLKKGHQSVSKEEILTASVRLSKSILPSGTAKEWNAELAIRLVKSKQFGAARKIFEELLLSEPTNVALLNNIAYVSGEQGDFTRAAEYLQTALQVSDNCAECHNNLGSLFYKQGKKEEARAAFDKATKVDGNYLDAKLNLAMMMEEDSDWQGALDLYKQSDALVTDPEVKKWVQNRAVWMAEIASNAKRNLAGDK